MLEKVRFLGHFRNGIAGCDAYSFHVAWSRHAFGSDNARGKKYNNDENCSPHCSYVCLTFALTCGPCLARPWLVARVASGPDPSAAKDRALIAAIVLPGACQPARQVQRAVRQSCAHGAHASRESKRQVLRPADIRSEEKLFQSDREKGCFRRKARMAERPNASLRLAGWRSGRQQRPRARQAPNRTLHG